ncbi:hypothetical protein TRVA0_010S00804 [Trichomonascus vanleenenianus]|uniref:uncharacterized protein n=1 Tax=Trichomonascus vanleenenianus TaxID=2268995 RepID=UPI003ECB814D
MTDFLSQLPAELLTKISEYLTGDGKSALSLSFANKQLYNTICPMLFKNITIEFGDIGALEVSNGFQRLLFPYGDAETMMKAVDCEFTQYFRQVEIRVVDYYSDYDEVLRYVLSMKALNRIRLSVREIDSRDVLGFLPIVPPSTQVDLNLSLSFWNMEMVSWLEGLVTQAPENINFTVSGNPKLVDLKRNPIPSLLARMENLALHLFGDNNVSELNEFLSHGLDVLREVHLVVAGFSANIVADQPCLNLPDQVNSLHFMCSVSGPNQLTITGKSLRQLECHALPPTVKVDAQIVDLTLDLMEQPDQEGADTPPIVAESYGITSGTDSIVINANIASTLRIKELIRVGPSKLTISYYSANLKGMMQTLVSQATESQLTEFKLRTIYSLPEKSTIEALAAFTANMPRLRELTVLYSENIREYVAPSGKNAGDPWCLLDLESLKKLREGKIDSLK